MRTWSNASVSSKWDLIFSFKKIFFIFFGFWWSWYFYHIYHTAPLRQDMTQGQFLSGVSQVWIQSFPSPRLVASPRLKNLVCPTILPIAGGRIIGFIPFPRVLALGEMQSVSSWIWTHAAVSISYDNNDYTTGSWYFYGVKIFKLKVFRRNRLTSYE